MPSTVDVFLRDAADDTVAERLEDVAAFHDRGDRDAVERLAILFGDDHVLGNVDQTTGEVTRVCGLQRRIREALASAVGGDEVLQHGETFTEVSRDRGFNDFAGRLGHEAAHAGELTDLLFGTTSAGVGHDVNRVHGPLLVGVLHVVKHLIGNFLSYR